jgi:hypothetical protein
MNAPENRKSLPPGKLSLSSPPNTLHHIMPVAFWIAASMSCFSPTPV